MGDVTRIEDACGDEARVGLDELAREGARRMIAAALDAEVDEYVSSLTDEVDEHGHRLVVRNGRGKERRVTVGSGTLAIRAPRVNDKRVEEESGERRLFSSRILPRYARRSPRVSDLLPVLYLRGLSSGDFAPALRELLGEGTPVACRRLRSPGSPRPGARSTSPSGAAGWISCATPTCSRMGSTFRCAWARTSACVCW